MADNNEALVKDVYRVNRVSKSGNPYQQIIFEFYTGYKFVGFLNDEQQFIFKDLPIKM